MKNKSEVLLLRSNRKTFFHRIVTRSASVTLFPMQMWGSVWWVVSTLNETVDRLRLLQYWWTYADGGYPLISGKTISIKFRNQETKQNIGLVIYRIENQAFLKRCFKCLQWRNILTSTPTTAIGKKCTESVRSGPNVCLERGGHTAGSRRFSVFRRVLNTMKNWNRSHQHLGWAGPNLSDHLWERDRRSTTNGFPGNQIHQGEYARHLLLGQLYIKHEGGTIWGNESYVDFGCENSKPQSHNRWFECVRRRIG